MNRFHHIEEETLFFGVFNSDARCEAGNYEREARLEGKAGNVDAVMFEKQGKRSSKKIGNVVENIVSITFFVSNI